MGEPTRDNQGSVQLQELGNGLGWESRYRSVCDLLLRGPGEWKLSEVSDPATVVSIRVPGESLVFIREAGVPAPRLYTNRPERWSTGPSETIAYEPNSLDALAERVAVIARKFLVDNCRITEISPATLLTREAVRFTAIPHEHFSNNRHGQFWPEVERYDVVADRDTGILLHYAAIDGGIEVASIVVESMTVNVPVPEDSLTIVVPAETVVIGTRLPGQEKV